MTQRRRIDRRSFLGHIEGSAAGIGALAIVGGSARAQTAPYTAVTDTDGGESRDPYGYGNGDVPGADFCYRRR